jgi:uncharacterized membrane protein
MDFGLKSKLKFNLQDKWGFPFIILTMPWSRLGFLYSAFSSGIWRKVANQTCTFPLGFSLNFTILYIFIRYLTYLIAADRKRLAVSILMLIAGVVLFFINKTGRPPT